MDAIDAFYLLCSPGGSTYVRVLIYLFAPTWKPFPNLNHVCLLFFRTLHQLWSYYINEMNIEATGPRSFPFFPHHQGFCLGSKKVWDWLYCFIWWVFLPNFMRHIAYRGSLILSQPLQHLLQSSIAHPEAGSSHSCLRAVLWMDPTKVPRWLFGRRSLNTLETSSATTVVPSILLFNIRCLCYTGLAANSVQLLLYVKIRCHEPLFPTAKHEISPEALHGTARSKYKSIKYKNKRRCMKTRAPGTSGGQRTLYGFAHGKRPPATAVLGYEESPAQAVPPATAHPGLTQCA